jgi:hypothetical protein
MITYGLTTFLQLSVSCVTFGCLILKTRFAGDFKGTSCFCRIKGVYTKSSVSLAGFLIRFVDSEDSLVWS